MDVDLTSDVATCLCTLYRCRNGAHEGADAKVQASYCRRSACAFGLRPTGSAKRTAHVALRMHSDTWHAAADYATRVS